MRPLRVIFAFVGTAALASAAEKNAPPPNAIVWDAMAKTVVAKPGEGAADFVFKATNVSDRTVTIADVRPSCGCTVVDLPANPWVLAPGASGALAATVDFTGKDGTLTKSLLIESTEGAQTLTLIVKIPGMDEKVRQRNQQLALANRQAVFRGDCASCHATPAGDKTGEALFQAACEICHVTSRRASMVPDLLVARTHRDAAWWKTWISDGKAGTLMPAFAKERGGPLTEAQIDSLVAFALARLPTEARSN